MNRYYHVVCGDGKVVWAQTVWGISMRQVAAMAAGLHELDDGRPEDLVLNVYNAVSDEFCSISVRGNDLEGFMEKITASRKPLGVFDARCAPDRITLTERRK